MKLGRLAAVVTVLGLCGSSAFAGNGSNFWHYQNGIDYYFVYTAGVPAPGNATWRCFPGSINHAPTKVVDPNAPAATFGTYASKIETLWINIVCGGGAGGQPVIFPYVLISSNPQTCRLVTTASLPFAAWGLATGLPTGVGPALVGPLPFATLQLNAFASGIVIPGNFPVNTITTVRLDVVPSATTPSAITVPEGSATAFVVADSPVQGAPGSGTHQYWTGSIDDRRVCSFQVNAGAYDRAGGTVGWYFIAAPLKMFVEWGNGVSTIDASIELGINNVGPGPGFTQNPGALYAAPYDAGQNGVVSITGSTLNGATAGEIFAPVCWDDNNPFGGSAKLSCLNLWGIHTTPPGWPYPAGVNPWCIAGGLLAPVMNEGGLGNVGTGGPGGPMLSGVLPQMVRSTGKFDFVTNNLLKNTFWLGSTTHSVAPLSQYYPFYHTTARGNPAFVKCGGSAGNNGGAQISIPALGTLVGLEFGLWQLNMNPAGTALSINGGFGHSHTNITPIGFAP
jgi:hypothetical protein